MRKITVNEGNGVVINVERTCKTLPEYAHPGDSGMDIRANITEPITLKPLERAIVPSGLKLEIPFGYEVQIRPRSGEAAKKGLTVLNTPGTIDSNYRGEVGIIMVNLSNTDAIIEPDERIAQMVVAKVEYVKLNEVEEIVTTTERGNGAYGSTGRF